MYFEDTVKLVICILIANIVTIICTCILDLTDKITEQEIIKKSDGYIVFEKYIKVQNNWYCKKENN